MKPKRRSKPDYSKAPLETLRRMGRYIPPHKNNRKIHPVVLPFYWAEKRLESLLSWLQGLALLEILGIVGNVGIILGLITYIGTEKQRRDSEVFNAWQTITGAYGQTGEGGRIKALEFLNASPGANWRRRASCLWLCTWPPESLGGIDLAVSQETKMTISQKSTLAQEWRKKPAVVAGVYLVGVQLPFAYLSDANLEGASLNNANLEEASLIDANLEEASLIDADLKRAFLPGANLERASLIEANLEGASLDYVKLKGANLNYAKLKGANLNYANLEGASLPYANLEDANLLKSNLGKADFLGANLRRAGLKYANLEEVNLIDTDLEGADLLGANLKRALLLRANLKGSQNLTPNQVAQAKLCRTQLPTSFTLDKNRDCGELNVDSNAGFPASP